MSGEVVQLPAQPSERIIMPANPEIEAALLGAMLVNNNVYFRVSRDLRPDHFFEPVHGEIYAAIAKVIAENGTATPLNLKNHFDKHKALERVGGGEYLYDLAASVITVVNSESYASAIIDLWQRRKLISLQKDAIDDLVAVDLDSSAADIGSFVAGQMSEVLTAGRSNGKTRRDVMGELMEELQRPVQASPTGLARLDKAMAGGLHRGRAYGIVGRKKAGKSALGGTISFNLNEAGVKHLVILLEMGSVSYEQRSIARALGFNSLNFLNQRKRNDPEFLNQVGNYIATAPDNVFYLDRPGLWFDELRQQLVHFVHKHKIKGVILDYLQLVGGRREKQSTVDHLDGVAQWLAEAAKTLGIWVLCMAQMNQDENVRGGESMRHSFDQVYALYPSAARESYLQMWDSRYTPLSDIGDEAEPAFELSMVGPHFREIDVIEDEDDDSQQILEGF